jgi:two-component system OmpR family sensor kinase
MTRAAGGVGTLRRALDVSRRSLTTSIVASVLALFLVVTLATSALTALLMRSYLLDRLDASVVASAQRISSHPGGFQGGPGDPGAVGGVPGVGDPGGDGDGPGGGGPPGAGTSFLLVLHGGTVTRNEVTQGRDYGQLSTGQVQDVTRAGVGPHPTTVDLGGDLGRYRVAAGLTRSGDTVVTGQAMSSVDSAVDQVVALVTAGTLIGLLLVGAGGTWLVRRNLRPLQRVAHTARSVAGLELGSGTVALAERVPHRDTDPRTEVGQVGLALNSMLDNVEGALRARQQSEMRVRQFVADASHELRTPLASIRGYAELSRRERGPVPPSVTHALGRVESEAVRMSELVDDLLLLARLDAGRPLDREPVDLTLLAVDAVGDAHAAAPDHRWELRLPDEQVEVTGDRARLHQVLVNLLANARTHTPAGTRVVTTVAVAGEWVRLRVSDNGPGVPESLQENVFERFARGDDSRARAAGSTGLGLSIVAAVAQAHGGRVELESRPGETTFTVTLPAKAAVPQPSSDLAATATPAPCSTVSA